MLIRLCVLAFLLSTNAFPKTKWRVQADKKPNPVTGQKNAWVWRYAEKGMAMLILGCQDGKPMMRVSENFGLANAINDAFTKSPLAQSIQRGIDAEDKGFRYQVQENRLMVALKLRATASAEYRADLVPLYWQPQLYVGILDAVLPDLIGQLRTSPKLVAEIPYKDKPGFAEWKLEGLSAAEDELAASGCRLPGVNPRP